MNHDPSHPAQKLQGVIAKLSLIQEGISRPLMSYG